MAKEKDYIALLQEFFETHEEAVRELNLCNVPLEGLNQENAHFLYRGLCAKNEATARSWGTKLGAYFQWDEGIGPIILGRAWQTMHENIIYTRRSQNSFDDKPID